MIKERVIFEPPLAEDGSLKPGWEEIRQPEVLDPINPWRTPGLRLAHQLNIGEVAIGSPHVRKFRKIPILEAA